MNTKKDDLPYMDPLDIDERKMHGCLRSWLIIGMLGYGLLALIYLFINNGKILAELPGSYGGLWVVVLYKILGLLNILFLGLTYFWKKIGVIGYAISSIIVFVISIKSGISLFYAIIFGLGGLIILLALLTIEEDETGRSAWKQMD